MPRKVFFQQVSTDINYRIHVPWICTGFKLTLFTLCDCHTETWNSGRMHLADNRTSLFDPGRGRSFLTTLGLAVFKIIKLACLCSFFTILLLLLCPLIPLLIPALFISLLFTFFLIGLLKFVPQVSMQMPPVPVPPTFPPGPPPFETVPAYV